MPKKLSRLGLIGDIHAEDVLLERALACLEARKVEAIATTGDIADGRGSVDECCALLESRKVIAVCGNHDRWLLGGTVRDLPDATVLETISVSSRTFLKGLPGMVELETVRGRALLCHGLGPNDMAKVSPDDFGYALDSNEDLQTLLRCGYYRWVMNGHSHRGMIRRVSNLTILNAGTLLPDHESMFLEINFEAGEVFKYSFDGTGNVIERPERSILT